MMRRKRGQLITFYSYKGGTGRTMAVANCACLLARGEVVPLGQEKRLQQVLAVDWDLEAPGLHQFLKPQDTKAAAQAPGLLELCDGLRVELEARCPAAPADEAAAKQVVRALALEEYALPCHIPNLWLIKAGRFDESYRSRATSFRWEKLFDRAPTLFVALARRLAEEFDFVLVDSRTGMSDTSGISTTLLPEKLVVVFTPNTQSLTGLRELVQSATAYRERSDDWRPLTVFPLASRIDVERPMLEKRWRGGDSKGQAEIPGGGYQPLFETTLQEAFGLESCDLGEYFAQVKLPHVSDYSYGEPLVVELERDELERDATLTLSQSYRQFALRLVSLAGPWENLDTVAAQHEIEALMGQAREAAEPAEAQKLLLRALEVHEESPEAVVASLAEESETLVRERLRGGRASEAVALAEGALKVVERAYGAGSHRSADSLALLAEVLAKTGDLEQALSLASRAGRLRSKALGQEHLSLASSHEQIGRLEAQTGRLEEAAASYRKSLAVRRKLLGIHPETASIWLDLAAVELDRDDTKAARKALGRVEPMLGEEGFGEIERAQLGIRLAGLFDRLGESGKAERLRGAVSKRIRLAREAETEPPPRDLRRRYLERLRRRLSPVALGGVDPAAALEEAAQRLELESIYTALMTTGTEAWGEGRSPELGRAEQARQFSALEQANAHPHLVLLGDPGSGKSTFVNFLALCLAGETLGYEKANLEVLRRSLPGGDGDEEDPRPQSWDHGPLLPIHVVLREFAARGGLSDSDTGDAERLWRFVEEQLAAANLAAFSGPLKTELHERGALLLLDGLDEVPAAEKLREKICRTVLDFARTYPKCRVLVTCRTYAYQRQQWRLEDFTHTVLAPFGRAQIEGFVDRWYAHVGQLRGLDRDDAKGRARLLKEAIAGSQRLGAFAERPLLLTLMASLHAWRGGSLPDQRERLYSDAVDLLLDAWERQRVIHGPDGKPLLIQPSLAEWLRVDRRRVREVLDRLAFEAHAGQEDIEGTADIAESRLSEALMSLSENPDAAPGRLVEYLRDRAGLLVERGVGIYAFPHRTFQEYLAACWLTEEEFPDQVADLARRDPSRWREVVLLAGAKAARGAAATVWQLAEALCWREPEADEVRQADTWGALLAGPLLVESADLGRVSDRNAERLKRYRRWQVQLLTGDELPALERAGAGRGGFWLGWATRAMG